MPETPITFEDVEVLRTAPLIITCRVQGKIVMVGRLQMVEGTTIASPGDRGRLVMPRWAVQDLGLTEPSS
jgi:hypothetical protein